MAPASTLTLALTLVGRCVELTLPQFYEFLSQMEKAKAQMSYFG